jgi:MFS family permease
VMRLTGLAGMLFQFCQTSAMMLMLYYIPEWLQAIKGDSAVESGIHTIPLVLSLIIASILTGQLTSKIGYYTPFGIASAIMMSIGSGLISTWSVDTSSGKWIGYQIVLGFGIGMGMQVATLAAQTVLDRKDVPIGMTLMFFMQQLGGAIFVSVGLNVLDIQLIGRLSGVYELNVVSMGATEFRKTVPPEILNSVLVAYNAALREVFIVGICLSCLALLGAVLIEFKSVKGRMALTGGRGGPGGPRGNPEAGEKSKESGKPDKKV